MRKLTAVFTLAAAPALAQYQFYLTDHLTSLDATKWTSTGGPSASASGLTFGDASGGSLISKIPIPDLTSEAEVDIALALKRSGGTYTEFLQASADAKTATASGTYLAFEMQNPTLNANGSCSAMFVVLQGIAGSVSAIAGFQHDCADGMVMKMAVSGGTVLVWPNQATPMEFPIAAKGTGTPGIGGYGMPQGNAISQVQLGQINRVAPAAVLAAKLTASVFRNRVELHWAAIAPLATGPGISGYWIYRDGAYLGRTSGVNFADESATAGVTYTYTVKPVDQHFNFSLPAAITVTTQSALPSAGTPNLSFISKSGTQPRPVLPVPGKADLPRPVEMEPRVTSGTPAGDSGTGMDPRRIGVRVAGGYWGGAGENIDAGSGNLNFTLPLIKPQARGGWGITFALSYNSQAWRHDSTVTYLLGQDVGYGLGWKLQAGSITPVYNSSSTIVYYLYTDSTGAEYSLSVSSTDGNGDSVWTPTDGIHITYDATANRLYSNDGSFWYMGCVSASGEPDAGTYYPTYIQDTNGNQLS